MLPKSYTALRAASFFAFLLALLVFSFSQVVTVASRRVEVRDLQQQVVGDAWIPHDYGRAAFTSICFVVLSGIPFWMVCFIGKSLSVPKNR